jgi:beta-glucosidase
MNWKSIGLMVALSAGVVFQVARAEDSKSPTNPATSRPTSKPTTKPAPKPRTPEDAVTPKVHSPDRHPKFLEEIKKGPYDLLFLGDSITDFWPKRGPESWKKLAEYKPLDLGVSGDRTEHVLWRIDNGELEGLSPKVTVIMIGTNNVGADKPEWVAAGVTKIVETVREKLPHTKILLLAIFPRSGAESKPRAANAAANDIIRKLADDKKVFYLDIGEKFLDPKGEIPKDVMADGLHPTAKGYDIWYDAMKPKLDELMK